ncbi:TfoX/Sxy family protein [Poritiphilus flavus]|uniref:TfoX N-terminal domain-containing protein n=1 Tax=Poritiphilus flavus TaxID=2697053 RepID=A0A6L9EC77_9FLAO|nr:TfoX/Sxy family protein [Poritiphilus flavus]NAS12340.1 hypothetical protein [Poritiphilus flavus]
MPYNEDLEYRLSQAITWLPKEVAESITKKKMFGGLAFLYKGKMTVGVVKDELMCRVVSGKMEEVLAREHVRPMDFTNRPMKEFVFVSGEGYRTEEQLQSWLELGIEHAEHALRK